MIVLRCYAWILMQLDVRYFLVILFIPSLPLGHFATPECDGAREADHWTQRASRQGPHQHEGGSGTGPTLCHAPHLHRGPCAEGTIHPTHPLSHCHEFTSTSPLAYFFFPSPFCPASHKYLLILILFHTPSCLQKSSGMSCYIIQ